MRHVLVIDTRAAFLYRDGRGTWRKRSYAHGEDAFTGDYPLQAYGMSPKVLLVEDSPTQALRTRITLETQGFDVVIVNESRRALGTAREERPDVVLSDVRMPGLDGFELTRRFRGDPELGHTPIVLNSATAHDEEDRELAQELGAQGYIRKGLEPSALASALKEAMAGGM